ncbi:MAG TPA: HEAT repeat domain-containing protein [Bryobacteraceae bacterium]|jgi:hypothetical protein
MSSPNCEWARNYLPLFLYQELSAEEEDTLQSHLAVCSDCRAALEVERQLHQTLDQEDPALPAGLLNACRSRFTEQMVIERALPKAGVLGRARAWFDGLQFAQSGWLRPAAAMALIAIGFFAGRMLPHQDRPAGLDPVVAAVAEPVSTRVRQVEPAGSGVFQIVLDETRERVVSGSPDEDRIRQLLISAASDPSDAGLRGETIGILSSVPPCDETRQALLTAVEHDSNDGVRLRALEGLKGMAQQSDVRRVLARVLLKDPNAGVRTQAIDLLTQSAPNAGIRENDMIGVFQDLMGREPNTYIRMRAERQLQKVKASTEVY